MRTFERPVMLARAITSVQQQTLKDWELVVVNNGGKPADVDRVVAIARIAHPDSLMTVLHIDERVGMEEASNLGLQATSSEFFVIHDDDDSWKPTFLERATQEMMTHGDAAAIVMGITRIHELARGENLRPQRAENFYLDQHRLTYEGMLGNNTFPPIAALFRRSVLDQVGYYDATLPVLGDWEFNLRAVSVGRFVYVPERLANYHTRTPDSDQSSGNSITVGQDLHRDIKLALHERWLQEVTPDGRNKGEVAKAAHLKFEQDEQERQRRNLVSPEPGVSRQIRRVVGLVRSPRRALRAAVRRIRDKVGR